MSASSRIVDWPLQFGLLAIHTDLLERSKVGVKKMVFYPKGLCVLPPALLTEGSWKGSTERAQGSTRRLEEPSLRHALKSGFTS